MNQILIIFDFHFPYKLSVLIDDDAVISRKGAYRHIVNMLSLAFLLALLSGTVNQKDIFYRDVDQGRVVIAGNGFDDHKLAVYQGIRKGRQNITDDVVNHKYHIHKHRQLLHDGKRNDIDCVHHSHQENKKKQHNHKSHRKIMPVLYNIFDIQKSIPFR